MWLLNQLTKVNESEFTDEVGEVGVWQIYTSPLATPLDTPVDASFLTVYLKLNI